MKKLDRYEFIWKAIQKHGYYYDYREFEYILSNIPSTIICPVHGRFKQKPNNHLIGQGCPLCFSERRGKWKRIGREEFIKRSLEIHHGKYDYSRVVDYENNSTSVELICPIHGSFFQTPDHHLRGQGCPKCNQSKLEIETKEILKELGIEYVEQYSREELKNGRGKMSLDFYLPNFNLGVECQGAQHFIPVKRFGGDKTLEEIVERDKKKARILKRLGIRIIYLIPENFKHKEKEILEMEPYKHGLVFFSFSKLKIYFKDLK